MSRYPKGYRKGDDVMPESQPLNPADALPDALRSMAPPAEPRTLSRDYIVVRDANGKLVPISVKAFINDAEVKGELFGMPFEAILTMQELYRERGGRLPMTAASMREVLG